MPDAFFSRLGSITVEMTFFLVIFLPTVFRAVSRSFFPAGIYMLKVNNRNTRTRYEICSKLTIKTPERRYFTPCSSVSIVNVDHVIGDCVVTGIPVKAPKLLRPKNKTFV